MSICFWISLWEICPVSFSQLHSIQITRFYINNEYRPRQIYSRFRQLIPNCHPQYDNCEHHQHSLPRFDIFHMSPFLPRRVISSVHCQILPITQSIARHPHSPDNGQQHSPQRCPKNANQPPQGGQPSQGRTRHPHQGTRSQPRWQVSGQFADLIRAS